MHGHTLKASERSLFLCAVEDDDSERIKKYIYNKSKGYDFFTLLKDTSRAIAEYLKKKNYIGVFSFSTEVSVKGNIFKIDLIEDFVLSFSFEFLCLKLKKHVKTGTSSYVYLENLLTVRKKGFASLGEYAFFLKESSQIEVFQQGGNTLFSKGKLILSDCFESKKDASFIFLDIK